MAYEQFITPEGSSQLEIIPSGTVYGQSVTVKIHTGTSCWISTGTYNSTEVGFQGRVVDAYAIEGEWKICKQNDNNRMVLDVATFPIRRKTQYCGSMDNDMQNSYEFPHHHYAPFTLSGTSVVLYSSETVDIDGLVTHGDYAYFITHSTFYTVRGIHRLNLITGVDESISYTDILANTGGYLENFQLCVIDDDTILFQVEVYNPYRYYFYTYNFSTSAYHNICSPPVAGRIPGGYTYNTWLWHWAVIGNKLCISGWNYWTDDVEYDQYVSYRNFIYNIDSGFNSLRYYHVTPYYKCWSNMQYPVCNDIIKSKKYFVQYHTGNWSPVDAGYTDEPRMFVFDVENDVISEVHPYYKGDNPSGDEGCHFMYHLCENPLNKMMYYIAYHTYDTGPSYQACYSIQVLDPGGYSNGTYYEISYLPVSPPYSQIPAALIPGMWGVYVVMQNGDVYDLMDIGGGSLPSPIFNLGIIWTEIPNYPYRVWTDMPQLDKAASCLDRWDRLWYIQGSSIQAVNMKTGVIEVDFAAGLSDSHRGKTCGITYNYSFQHIYLARNRIIVLENLSDSCGVSPYGMYIIRIE